MDKLVIAQHIATKISHINTKYKNINFGGCGTFSYYLHHALKTNYDIDTEIVYIPSETPPGKMPTYDVKFNHILVKWDNWLIDNNGFVPDNQWKTEYLGVQKLEEMIQIPELWNDIYDHNLTKDISTALLRL